MLHRTFRNDDFQRKSEKLAHCNTSALTILSPIFALPARTSFESASKARIDDFQRKSEKLAHTSALMILSAIFALPARTSFESASKAGNAKSRFCSILRDVAQKKNRVANRRI